MRSFSDPHAYYATLGVSPDASADAIVAAFRRLAKQLHPDIGTKRDATAFIRLREAFEVLSDPARRSAYDAAALTATNEPIKERRRFIPLCCERCHAISAQPRYCVFWSVFSFVVGTIRTPHQGIFCPRCASKLGAQRAFRSAAFGWWGVAGLFWTPRALWEGFPGGEHPTGANQALLIHQALAFLDAGQTELAFDCIRQAERFGSNDDLLTLRLVLDERGFRSTRKLRDSWTALRLPSILFRAMPVASVLSIAAAAVLILMGEYASLAVFQSIAPSGLGQPAVTQYVRNEGGTEFWTDNGRAYVNTGTQPRYTTISVLGPAQDPDFVRVRLADGRVGLFRAAHLALGDGAMGLRNDCRDSQQAPLTNDIFSQIQRGPHRVVVENQGEDSAVVKLRSDSGIAMITFYVSGGSTATIGGVPAGRLRPEFAFGREWSRTCGRFLIGMRTQAYPDYDEFPPAQGNVQRNVTWTYTITPVAGGNVRPQTIPVEAFMRP